jgi:EAL domain-containing protein (putative c-di-GMP-specific phosphodiesterase class I)
VELELAAIRKAIATLERLPEGTHLAVNASPQTLVSPLLDATLSAAPGHRLIVELTEHARVEDYALVKPAVERLRLRGIRLAIDDAGAGFSSLQHILHLRPDLIKLDRSLTQAIDTDPVRYALAAALVTFAASLDAEICAEGIEKASELVALQRLGVAYGQGYFLGRPLPLPLAAPPRGVWLDETDTVRSLDGVGDTSIRANRTMRRTRLDSIKAPPASPSTYPSPLVLDRDRLAAIHSSDLLDTPPEEAFDRITRWASALLRAPIAMFTIVDRDRQFFKSVTGLSDSLSARRDTPLSHSLCQHVVTTDGPLVISDALQHPLVRDNGAVTGLGVAAYLGVPVHGAAGRPIGALCVVDTMPRAWTPADAGQLSELACAIETELQLREFQRQNRKGRPLAVVASRPLAAEVRQRLRGA